METQTTYRKSETGCRIDRGIARDPGAERPRCCHYEHFPVADLDFS